MSSLTDKNRQKAEERILKNITIKCRKCHGLMKPHLQKGIPTELIDKITSRSIGVQHLENAIVGYSCEDCPHYYFFNNNPV